MCSERTAPHARPSNNKLCKSEVSELRPYSIQRYYRSVTVARWREIAEDLRTRIATGEFDSTGQLPSITELLAHYDVSGPNTIRSAQRQLAQQGLLEIRQGMGAFVVSKTPVAGRAALLAQLREARAANQRLAVTLDNTITLLERVDADE